MNRYVDADLVKGAFQDKYVVYDDTLEIINSVPTADVRENVHGEWIDTGSGQECSVCKEVQYGYDNFRNFCPNCGAVMSESLKWNEITMSGIDGIQARMKTVVEAERR